MGAAYCRSRSGLLPLLADEEQESGQRVGTETIPDTVGFGVAAQSPIEEKFAESTLK